MRMISIVVPVYNASKYIDECLESICSQTIKNIEIILVNDGSTDDSEDKCKKWESKDSRITYYSQKNSGVSVARNKGIGKASGEYITFIDSDDVIDREYCEKLLRKMKSDVDMVILGMARLYGNKIIPIRHRIKSGKYNADELKCIVIDDGTMSGFTFQSPCATLYRRELLEQANICFDDCIRFNEDGLFNVHYVFACTQNIIVDFKEVIYFYRVNDLSSSSSVDLTSNSFFVTLAKIENSLKKNATLYPEYDIHKQVSRRVVSTSLSQLRYAAKHNSSVYVMKKIIDSEGFRLGLSNIDMNMLPLKKKLVFLLLKTKNVRLIKLILRFV